MNTATAFGSAALFETRLPLRVRGIVRHGDKRGRLLGFPTANLTDAMPQDLPFGVYASETEISSAPGRRYRSLSSYGTRPTFDGAAPRLETYILDFAGDLYGQEITVQIVDFIRAELRFNSVTELVAAMQQDLSAVQQMPLDAPHRGISSQQE